MQKVVAPSVIAREQLQGLLSGGTDRETNIVSRVGGDRDQAGGAGTAGG